MTLSYSDIARIAHEANRAYCVVLGDALQGQWDEAPIWQKDSARNGVKAIAERLVNSPEQSHQSWMREKIANGWKYGEIKDPEAKTHPCLIPYDELPRAQRVKDHLFWAVVTTLLISAEMKA